MIKRPMDPVVQVNIAWTCMFIAVMGSVMAVRLLPERLWWVTLIVAFVFGIACGTWLMYLMRRTCGWESMRLSIATDIRFIVHRSMARRDPGPVGPGYEAVLADLDNLLRRLEAPVWPAGTYSEPEPTSGERDT